jgi:predicted CopG family antitoxin
MSNGGDSFNIPSVDERVNTILQTFSLNIHLMASMLSKNYLPFTNCSKKYLHAKQVSSYLKVISQVDRSWEGFYQKYEKRIDSTREKATSILKNMRDSSIGIPILTTISKHIFKDKEEIKKYLRLYITEDVYNKMSDEKKQSVPNVLFELYKKYFEKGNNDPFEELASRLLNKMFFSSTVVDKVNEELQHRLFTRPYESREIPEAQSIFHSDEQIFCIYMDEKSKFSSNPFDFYLVRIEDRLIEPFKTVFRTHYMVCNYIKNNSKERPFSLFMFNTNVSQASKIEDAIKKSHPKKLKKVFKL